MPEAPVSPLSFFGGHLGVAYAAHRVGDLTGQVELGAQAEAVLDRVVEAATAAHLLDVIGGNAGAIPALLALGRERCRELAIALGEELYRTAVRRGSAWVWDVEVASGPGFGSTPLTGLSHGAAGIGLALFELHAATGRLDFLEAARGAFASEDTVFDPQQGNWPDLRTVEAPGAPTRPPSAALAWCHGAPGIALSRLRALTLDPTRQETHRVTARTAIAMTLKAIEAHLALPRGDVSLCHGLAGLAEIVLIAGQLLEDRAYRDRAVAVGRLLVERHAAAGDWPSGVPSGGSNPSLMLGTAGVGYSLLRLSDPTGVPPILLLIP